MTPPSAAILARKKAKKAAAQKRYRDKRSAVQRAKECEAGRKRKAQWLLKPGNKERDRLHKDKFNKLQKQLKNRYNGDSDDGLELE